MTCVKPLDSSAFVPDAALPPASMQAGLRRNDGAFCSLPPFCFSACFLHVAPSSFQRRLESRRPGRRIKGLLVSVRSCQSDRMPTLRGHSRAAGMDDINHWIPACAGMTGLFVHCHPFYFSACFFLFPRRHSSAGWNPGGRAEGLRGCRFLSARASLT